MDDIIQVSEKSVCPTIRRFGMKMTKALQSGVEGFDYIYITLYCEIINWICYV